MKKECCLVLIDGVCNVCNRFARFVIRNDSEALFQFGSLQSQMAVEIFDSFNIPNSEKLNGIVLIQNGVFYRKSEALAKIFNNIGGIYRFIAWISKFVPTRLLDYCYDFFATYRHRIIPSNKYCDLPTEDVRKRFIDKIL